MVPLHKISLLITAVYCTVIVVTIATCYTKTVNQHLTTSLNINTTKTEVLYQPSPTNATPQEPEIKINGETLKVVSNFKYLGSIITPDNRVDMEVSNRIKNACAAYGKMEKKL